MLFYRTSLTKKLSNKQHSFRKKVLALNQIRQNSWKHLFNVNFCNL